MDIEMDDIFLDDSGKLTNEKRESVSLASTPVRTATDIDREYFYTCDDIRRLEKELYDFVLLFKNVKEAFVLFLTCPFGLITSIITFLSAFHATMDASNILLTLAMSILSGTMVTFVPAFGLCTFLPKKTEQFLVKHSLWIKGIYDRIQERKKAVEDKRNHLIELHIEKETLNTSFVDKEKLFNEKKNEIDTFNKFFSENLKLTNLVDYEDCIDDSKKNGRGRKLIRGPKNR